ncbi:MAG: glycine zipper domain-containing protein [Gemmataceae bacterium]|jgi:uncharacterized protein YcfJ|nr:glycine zipper domain-containing protein [Gemmataceae bacterium]
MRRLSLIGLSLSVCLFGAGCSGMSKTAQGAGIGAGIGAGAGAILGQASGGKAGKGALIGAAAGTVLGGLIGNEEDRKDKEVLEDRVRAAEHSRDETLKAVRPKLTLEEIVKLTQDGVSDDIIINQIRTTQSRYELTTEQISYLKSYNVSNAVIREMQNRRTGQAEDPVYRRPREVIVAPPPPTVVRPVYVVEPIPVLPPPPPRPGFSIGFRSW